jgi:hypothetical protein
MVWDRQKATVIGERAGGGVEGGVAKGGVGSITLVCIAYLLITYSWRFFQSRLSRNNTLLLVGFVRANSIV